MKNNLIFKILLILHLATVAWLCFGHFDNVSDVPKAFWGIPTDKIVHFLMFFPFPVLCYLAFDRFTTKWWHSLLFAGGVFLTGCLIAAATEIGQGQTSYRSGDITDFCADGLALLLSSLAVLVIDLWKQRRP